MPLLASTKLNTKKAKWRIYVPPIWSMAYGTSSFNSRFVVSRAASIPEDEKLKTTSLTDLGWNSNHSNLSSN